MSDDSPDTLIAAVLDLDTTLQQLLRINWPESWLKINLPLGSTRALLAVENRNARTPGQIAEILGVSRTTATGVIDRLEDEGLLTRSIDPHDRRCFVLHVTEQGRALIREIDQFRRDQLELALAAIDTSSLSALATGLGALVQQVQSITPRPAVAPSKEGSNL